jgi:hypothetical protein
MPDFQQFAITRQANRNLNVPTWSVELLITDSQTGVVLRDFTGANALSFPQILGQLTAAQQDEFVSRVIQMLILWRAGLE